MTISINISPEFTLIKQHHSCYRTINLYSICQHFFLPVYAYFTKCWHRLYGLFQHVILWILKTMIPKLIIKIQYSNYKINPLSKCQKYNNFKSHSVIVLTRKIFDDMIFLLITTTGGRTILFSVCNETISIFNIESKIFQLLIRSWSNKFEIYHVMLTSLYTYTASVMQWLTSLPRVR